MNSREAETIREDIKSLNRNPIAWTLIHWEVSLHNNFLMFCYFLLTQSQIGSSVQSQQLNFPTCTKHFYYYSCKVIWNFWDRTTGEESVSESVQLTQDWSWRRRAAFASQNQCLGTSSEGPVVKTSPSNAGDMSLIPAMIPHSLEPKKQKHKTEAIV